MRKTRFILLFLTGLTLKSVLAQKQANIWHYGQNHCLDFSSGAPVYISGSPMSTFEGSASYSDQHGKLLFFTNGGGGVFNAPGLPFSMPGAIWNRNNAVMHAIPMGWSEGIRTNISLRSLLLQDFGKGQRRQRYSIFRVSSSRFWKLSC